MLFIKDKINRIKMSKSRGEYAHKPSLSEPITAMKGISKLKAFGFF